MEDNDLKILIRELGSDRELLKMRDLFGRTALHLAVNSQNIHLVKVSNVPVKLTQLRL